MSVRDEVLAYRRERPAAERTVVLAHPLDVAGVELAVGDLDGVQVRAGGWRLGPPRGEVYVMPHAEDWPIVRDPTLGP